MIAGGRSAGGLGREDEGPLTQHDHLPAYDARHRQPFDRADADEHQQDRTAENHHQQDHHEHEGQCVEAVDDPHHGFIHPAAAPARNRTPGDADDQRNERCGQRHRERDARADQRAGKQITTNAISAKGVARRKRRGTNCIPVDKIEPPGKQRRPEERGEEDQTEDEQREPHPRALGSSQP